MGEDGKEEKYRITVNQTACEIKNSTGVKITSESKHSKTRWYFNPWVVTIGCGVILWFIYLILSNIVGGGEVMSKRSKKKIDEIQVEQKGELLKKVDGVNISNEPSDIDIGKVDVKQEGKILNDVTGMKMQFDENSGEIRARGKWDIQQNTPGGHSRVTINADQPGVEVIFNKKTIKKEEDEKNK